MKRDTGGATTAMSKDDSSGRIIVQASSPLSVRDVADSARANAGITAAMTRPTTSSMIAALISIVPIRDCPSERDSGSAAVAVTSSRASEEDRDDAVLEFGVADGDFKWLGAA